MNTATDTMMQAHVARRPSSMWINLLGIASALIAIVCGAQLMLSSSLSESWPAQISAILVLWGLLYTVATRKIFGTIYLFGSAYLFALCIFHLGQVMYHGLGVEYFKHYTSGSFAIMLQRASWASLMAAACFGLGTALSVRRRPPRALDLPPDVLASNRQKTLGAAYWIGVGFLAASVVGLGLTFITVGNIFAYSRTEYFGGLGDTRGFGLFILAAPSAAVLMVVGARKRSHRFLAYFTAAVIAAFLLMLGYRSSALFSGLVGAVVWVKVGRKIPVTAAIIAILVVVTAIPTVRVLRQMGAAEDISRERLREAYNAASSKETILEIGGTNGILAHVLDWVPDDEPHWYGSSYLWAVRNAIPNVGMEISQADKSRLGESLESLRSGSPSRWFIFKTNRWKFDNGQGSGFSAVAESYLNFGWAGVVVFFVGMGFVLGRLDQVDLKTHPKTLIFSGGLLWPLVKTVRNTFGVFLQPLGLMLVVIAIWKIATFWRQNR